MPARNKPFDQFGTFILFKRLEADSLGELWRAGRIEDGQLGHTVALRRLSGGNRAALVSAIEAAQHVPSQLHGASFARDQVYGVIDGVPYVAHDYAGGRSLRHIIDRARGVNGTTPNPLPIDQAIVIAERVALSLTTMSDLRDASGNRLSHGALIPQFVWISDDGEIRVAGQQLGAGFAASLSDTKVSADVGRYFSPEYRSSGVPSKSSEVFAMGAILFLVVTGQEPPDAATASAFGNVIRAAQTMAGGAIPEDIRAILEKSLTLDPAARYATIGDMKSAISALASGGKYSATTFNLAFYLSSLLKKEMEGESIDREKEAKVNVAPYLEAPAAPRAVESAPASAPSWDTPAASAALAPPTAGKSSRLPLAIAAGVVLVAAGVGGYMMLNKTAGTTPVPTQVVQASTITSPKPQAPVLSEPILASTSTATLPSTATTGTLDPEAQKKAFEEAVRRQMDAEMLKLQREFNEKLKKEQSQNAPVQTAPAPAPVEERASVSAAQLDAQRRETTRAESPAPAPQTASAAPQNVPAPVQTQPAVTPQVQTPAPAPQVATIREGDVVDVLSLDVVPRAVRAIRPVYPPIAARQKITAEIMVTALISENGDVLEVRVLRGHRGFGLDDAAMRAMKQARFTSPMKGGKKVKTWYPQTIVFAP